jgi:hypothetical protein
MRLESDTRPAAENISVNGFAAGCMLKKKAPAYRVENVE